MIGDHIFLTAINVILAWSVYVSLMTGLLSFASGAFMAVGGYVAALLTTRIGWPLYPACLTGAIAAGFLGFFLGFPALRVRGIYLILVTLGFSISTVVIFESIDYVGGTMGMGGMSGANYVDAIITLLVVGGLLYLTSKSPLQRCLDAVREDDRVAASLGINVVFVKVAAFTLSAVLAGIAGALYAHYLGFIRPDTFDVELALFIVLYVILGGTNNMWGPALGATIMTLLPEYIAFLKEWRPTVFAAFIIIMLLIRPEGLLTFRTTTIRLPPQADRQAAIGENG